MRGFPACFDYGQIMRSRDDCQCGNPECFLSTSGGAIFLGMDEPRYVWLRQFLIGLGLMVAFPASFVARLAESNVGYYAAGLALIGGGIAVLGIRIGRPKND